MAAARVTFGATTTDVVVDGQAYSMAWSGTTLRERHIHTDPPLPEELTNAIGEVVDHLEDAKRELAGLAEAFDVEVDGALPQAVAAVEEGRPLAPGVFRLDRGAAEDVFRTVATETRAERRHNPGLTAELVDDIVGGCCALVGLMRALHLDHVDVVIP